MTIKKIKEQIINELIRDGRFCKIFNISNDTIQSSKNLIGIVICDYLMFSAQDFISVDVKKCKNKCYKVYITYGVSKIYRESENCLDILSEMIFDVSNKLYSNLKKYEDFPTIENEYVSSWSNSNGGWNKRFPVRYVTFTIKDNSVEMI